MARLKFKKNRKHVFNECANAIKRTLAYRSLFNYPLSFFQLSTFLISEKSFSHKLLKRELRNLLESGEVYATKVKFYLHGGKRLVDWLTRLNTYKDMLWVLKAILKLVKKIPWIVMIGVTGSVAAYNSTLDDDIDIFIITKKRRIWLTRVFVVLILKIVALYRTPENFAKKLCPNLFITEDVMAWPKTERNVYVAHEIMLLQPIYYKNNTYFDFISANKWALEYFPHAVFGYPAPSERKSHNKPNLLNHVEELLMLIQRAYMSKRRTQEIVTPTKIHFNKVDSKNVVTENYKKVLDDLALRLIE